MPHIPGRDLEEILAGTPLRSAPVSENPFGLRIQGVKQHSGGSRARHSLLPGSPLFTDLQARGHPSPLLLPLLLCDPLLRLLRGLVLRPRRRGLGRPRRLAGVPALVAELGRDRAVDDIGPLILERDLLIRPVFPLSSLFLCHLHHFPGDAGNPAGTARMVLGPGT